MIMEARGVLVLVLVENAMNRQKHFEHNSKTEAKQNPRIQTPKQMNNSKHIGTLFSIQIKQIPTMGNNIQKLQTHVLFF